jgi:hypothetical protein
MSNKSVLTNIPKNTNLLSPNKFIFTIPNLTNTMYFCQSVSLPGVSTSEVPVDTPFSTTYRHGDKLQFDPLVITFLVDEDLRNWEEIHNWLTGLTFPEKHEQYKQQAKKGLYFDASLQINKNSNEENIRIKYFHCHPVSLGPIQFDYTNDPSVALICDLTLRYDRYILERTNP